MDFRCPLCENEIETAVDVIDGQHVICPYCSGKFTYFQQQATRSSTSQRSSRIDFPAKKLGRNILLRYWEMLKSSFRIEERLSRADYCIIAIPTIVIAYVLSRMLFLPPIAHAIVEGGAVFILLSSAIRRLNDSGKSAYWVLLFVGLVSLFKLDAIYNLMFLALCALKSDNGAKRGLAVIAVVWAKVAFAILVLVYPLAYGYHTHRVISNAKTMVARIRKNAPFRNIGWSLIQGGDGVSSVYMFTTDAPARAKYIAVYVMGSLQSLEMTQIEDPSKQDAVEDYIRNHFELEGTLHRQRQESH